MKYECNECGRVFDAEDAITRTTTGVNCKTPCDYDICPFCESEDLTEDYNQPVIEDDSAFDDGEDGKDSREGR